jgi:hypothetical protein
VKKQILIYIAAFLVILGIVLELLNEKFTLDHWGSVIILLGFILSLIDRNIKIKQEQKTIEKTKERIKKLEEDAAKLQEKLGYLLSSEAETYYFDVDYSKNIKEMISQGNYDWQNDDINNFSFKKTENTNKIVKVAAKVLPFKGKVDEETKNMESKGFHPATAFELLAFGATHSEVQRKFPIMALGTISKMLYSNSICLCLYNCDSKRKPGQRGLGVHYYVFGPREENCHLLGIKILG